MASSEIGRRVPQRPAAVRTGADRPGRLGLTLMGAKTSYWLQLPARAILGIQAG